MPTIDPSTKVISILQSELTLVSGALYELDTDAFRLDVLALLDDEDRVWLPDAFVHNTEVTVAGVTYARTIEVINGYSITFENNVYSVRLVGSNNNLFDVENGILNPSGNVTVIPTNSAGLQTVTSGSGLSAAQATQLLELWQLQGLQLGNPMTVTPTQRKIDDDSIDLTLTGDGETSSVVTREA